MNTNSLVNYPRKIWGLPKLTNVSLPQGKVWQQLNTAWLKGADQIWVINVADIKPMELPLSLIMAMAWNGSYVSKYSILNFLEDYASREFGLEYAESVVGLLLGHSRLAGL